MAGHPILRRLEALAGEYDAIDGLLQYVQSASRRDPPDPRVWLLALRLDHELGVVIHRPNQVDQLAAAPGEGGTVRYAHYWKSKGTGQEAWTYATRRRGRRLLEGTRPQLRIVHDLALTDRSDSYGRTPAERAASQDGWGRSIRGP